MNNPINYITFLCLLLSGCSIVKNTHHPLDRMSDNDLNIISIFKYLSSIDKENEQKYRIENKLYFFDDCINDWIIDGLQKPVSESDTLEIKVNTIYTVENLGRVYFKKKRKDDTIITFSPLVWLKRSQRYIRQVIHPNGKRYYVYYHVLDGELYLSYDLGYEHCHPT